MHGTKFSLEKYSPYESLRICKLNLLSKGVVLFEQIILKISVYLVYVYVPTWPSDLLCEFSPCSMVCCSY